MLRKKISLLLLIVFIGGTSLTLSGCSTQKKDNSFPSKPITWIVPFGTGGGSDQFARMMEKQIESISDTEIVVVNMPGAKTAVGFNHLMEQEADGHIIYGSTTDSIINIATGAVEYGLDNIAPIAKVQHNVDMWFINRDDSRFSSYDDVIQYAKDHPRELSIATTGLDGADAISIKQIEKIENVKFKIIPFSQPGERYAALAGGHVDILHEQPGDVLSFLDSKKYKPIISMSEERIEGFNDVPSSLEKGIDITAGYWRGIWAKEGTSQEAVHHITKLIEEAIETNEYKEYEKKKYLHLREGLSIGDELKQFIQKEYEYYKQ